MGTNSKKKSKKTVIAPKEYPKNGTTKEKLTYIFIELSDMLSANSKTMTHKRSSTEISKKKLDLLEKLLNLLTALNTDNQDDAKVDNLVTPTFIIKAFKKIFASLLKDKKVSVHRHILAVFNNLICSSFTRQAMAEQLLFSMKPLMHHLTQNNSKTVNAAKESIQLLINEVLMEDNKKLLKVLIIELLRYSTSSKKKIVRKYCWLFIHIILESKYNIKKATKKVLKPPTTSEGSETKENEANNLSENVIIKTAEKNERSITKKKKPSKSIMDALSNGLKQGLNDKDREVKFEAMNVLNLFSLLEETKADRLIAKMSTSTRKLFDSKYGDADNAQKSGKKLKAPKVTKRQRSKSPGSNKKKKKSAKKRKSFSLKEDPESLKKA